MMTEKVQSLFSPCPETIRKHLEFITSGMDQYADGRMEVGGLSKTENYALSEIDKKVAAAVKLNETGQNTYLVGALLDPDIFPTGRSGDKDFYASSVVWADIDDPHDADALKSLYAVCPPNRAVVTARTPTRRIQLWWKLSEPLGDSDTLREALIGICQALGGDSMVTNPASLMRVAGTVNFPTEKKQAKGRVTEKTEYVEIHNNTYDIDEILRAYPVKDYRTGIGAETRDYTYTASKHGLNIDPPKIEDGREAYMHRMVFAAIIALTGDLGRWPDPREVFDDVWPVYARNVNPRNGRTLDQDGRGQKAVAQKIQSKLRMFKAGFMKAHGMGTLEDVILKAGAKKKPEPEEKFNPETGEIYDIRAIDIGDIDLDNIPPRAWLFGDIVARKYVSMIAASPGAGKSVFTMQMGLCAAAGQTFGPYKPHEPSIKTWVYNNEEGDEELRRRVAAMLKYEKIDKQKVSGKFFMNSGEQQSICIARKNLAGGGVLHTPDYDNLKAEIVRRGIDLLIVDPFAETHDVNENSNDEIKTVAGLYRKIAIECNCAVLLVHHTRKGSNASEKSNEQNSNADSARGGGAQIGVVRRMFTLAKMDSTTAAKFNVPDDQRYWYVRFDDAKTNITAPSQVAQWFKFESIALNNGKGIYTEGDKVGVLSHKTQDEIMSCGTDSMKSERVVLMTKIASIMINMGADEIKLSALLEVLQDSGYVKYKERALRNFIEETLCYKSENQPVICQGFRCVMKFIEGQNKSSGHKIILRKEVIND
jgi:hypothetical protein